MAFFARNSFQTSTNVRTVMMEKIVSASSSLPQRLYTTPTPSSSRIIGSVTSSLTMARNLTS